MLDSASFNMAYVVLTLLFLDKNQSITHHISKHMQFFILGSLFAICSLGQCICAPLLGLLSDKKGRKCGLFVSLFGSCLANLFTAYAIYLNSLWFLFVTRLLAGLSAGNLSIAQASLSDISPKKSRAVKFNFLEIGLGLGLILGAWFGTHLIKTTHTIFNYSRPFYALFFINLIVLLLFMFLFNHKKTAGKSPNNDLTNNHLQNVGLLTRLKTLKQLVAPFKIAKLRLFFMVWAISMLGYNGYLQFFTAFLKQRVDLSAHEIGNLFSIASLVYIILQVTIAFPILKNIRPNRLVKLSLIIFGGCIVCLGFSYNEVMIYFFRLAYMMAIIIFMPTFNAVVANEAKDDIRGQTFGIISAIYALVSALAGLIFAWIMNYSVILPIIMGGMLILFSGLLLVAKS